MSTRKNTIIGIALGIGAGFAYGVSAVLIRQGVHTMAPPLVGAAIAMLFGTLGMFFIGGRGVKSSLVENRKSVIILLCAGLAAVGGILSNYFALSRAPVVVVSPVQSITPLFALLWSWLFLGRLEKITPRLVLGTVLVVFGIVLIVMGRNI